MSFSGSLKVRRLGVKTFGDCDYFYFGLVMDMLI